MMADSFDLQRFVQAQDAVYDQVLDELREGHKRSHWMWFIFPQIEGLGQSATACYYGISGLEEASAYLDHPRLSSRLRECCDQLLRWAGQKKPDDILGEVDAMKLKSSMTLFESAADGSLSCFARIIDCFFDGARDQRTLDLLARQSALS